jgi:catechol 2,3-dioxygenase-like lactoylglutathione lyase family enzyme
MGIKVNDIAFVRFRVPALDVMQVFLEEFGMQCAERTDDTLYMRGTDDEGFVHVTHLGDDASFIGLAFEASSEADLDHLAAEDEFSDVVALDGPGEGRVVRTTDPNGFQVEVVAGRGSVGRLPVPAAAIRNDAAAQPRKGARVGLESGPSHVKRLGHCVLNVIDYRASEAWYKQHFGLVTSDEIQLDERTALGAFLRCDQGDRYVDHHTIFLVGVGEAKFNHAAFEVTDFDGLMCGHTHLTTRDRNHQWGVRPAHPRQPDLRLLARPLRPRRRALDRRRLVQQHDTTPHRRCRQRRRLAVGPNPRRTPNLSTPESRNPMTMLPLSTTPFEVPTDRDMLPSERRVFVETHRTCVLAYARRDDGPAQSVVYYVPTDGGELLVSTMHARAKTKAVERLGKVSVLVLDERWPVGYLQVYCDAIVDRDPRLVVDVMMAVGERMSGEPIGEEARPFVERMAEDEGRVVLRCRPYATFATPPRHLHRNDQEDRITHWLSGSVPWTAADSGVGD